MLEGFEAKWGEGCRLKIKYLGNLVSLSFQLVFHDEMFAKSWYTEAGNNDATVENVYSILLLRVFA